MAFVIPALSRCIILWLKKLRGLFRSTVCSHEFKYKDLKQTGIPDLEVPKTNGYKEWQEYYQKVYTHDSVTKRVVWFCHKCKKVFYAQCGLDILKHGRAVAD